MRQETLLRWNVGQQRRLDADLKLTKSNRVDYGSAKYKRNWSIRRYGRRNFGHRTLTNTFGRWIDDVRGRTTNARSPSIRSGGSGFGP